MTAYTDQNPNISHCVVELPLDTGVALSRQLIETFQSTIEEARKEAGLEGAAQICGLTAEFDAPANIVEKLKIGICSRLFNNPLVKSLVSKMKVENSYMPMLNFSAT